MRRQSSVSRRKFFASAIGAAALGRIGSAASKGQASAAAPAVRPAAASPGPARRHASPARAVSALARRRWARGRRARGAGATRQVGPRRAGCGVRIRVRVADRCQGLPRDRQRHQRAHHIPGRARHRPRRRGDRPALHVHRDGQRRAADARPAGLRRHRHRDLPDRRPQDRSGDHAAHARGDSGAPRRIRRRPRHHPADRQSPRHPRRSRTPVRRTSPNGADARSAATAAPAASAFRRARISIPEKGARSSPATRRCWRPAIAFTTTAAAGAATEPTSPTPGPARTCASPSSRPRCCWRRCRGWKRSRRRGSRTPPT